MQNKAIVYIRRCPGLCWVSLSICRGMSIFLLSFVVTCWVTICTPFLRRPFIAIRPICITWRHPLTRKYIKNGYMVSHNMHYTLYKTGKDWARSSRDMLADIQTDSQTHKHAHHYTSASMPRYIVSGFWRQRPSAVLYFQKLKILRSLASEGQFASPCKISSKSVRTLRRYGI